MAERDRQHRREELMARRAGLSSKQQALLEQCLKGSAATAPGDHSTAYLVPFQIGQAAYHPLFLIHPVNGQVSCYVDLVRYLDPNQPCYGIQAASPTAEGITPLTIEMLAVQYVQLIRNIQAEGPYRLGGWSFGGVVAFEMAQQLRAQQQAVALLALIDSQFTTDPAGAPADDEAAEMIGFAVAFGLPLKFGDSVQLTLDQQYAQALEYLRDLKQEERLAYMLAQAQQAHLAVAGLSPEQLRRAFHVYQVNARAMKQYGPRPYQDSIIWFKAAERLGPQRIDPVSDWEGIAVGEINVHTVPGNHYSVLHVPQVQVLAAQLQQQLTQLRSYR
jgi:thioesterase domain-containing protein